MATWEPSPEPSMPCLVLRPHTRADSGSATCFPRFRRWLRPAAICSRSSVFERWTGHRGVTSAHDVWDHADRETVSRVAPRPGDTALGSLRARRLASVHTPCLGASDPSASPAPYTCGPDPATRVSSLSAPSPPCSSLRSLRGGSPGNRCFARDPLRPCHPHVGIALVPQPRSTSSI